MGKHCDRAASYQLRAEELRTIADLDKHPTTRNMLLQVAKDYDQMAASVLAIAQSRVLAKPMLSS